MEKIISTIRNNERIVIFTGAGVSTASGIPDFRGENGLYQKNMDESVLSNRFMNHEPDKFWEIYKQNMLIFGVKPNIIHTVLADLEKIGKINAIITQNIDGLHQAAGSENVVELHGNGKSFYCENCKSRFSDEYMSDMEYSICPICMGHIRPDIVLYGEKLEDYKIWEAKAAISNAKVLIVLGTSLTVDPAASLVKDFIVSKRIKEKSDKLIIVNKGETPYDFYASKYDIDLIEVFSKISQELNLK